MLARWIRGCFNQIRSWLNRAFRGSADAPEHAVESALPPQETRASEVAAEAVLDAAPAEVPQPAPLESPIVDSAAAEPAPTVVETSAAPAAAPIETAPVATLAEDAPVASVPAATEAVADEVAADVPATAEAAPAPLAAVEIAPAVAVEALALEPVDAAPAVEPVVASIVEIAPVAEAVSLETASDAAPVEATPLDVPTPEPPPFASNATKSAWVQWRAAMPRRESVELAPQDSPAAESPIDEPVMGEVATVADTPAPAPVDVAPPEAHAVTSVAPSTIEAAPTAIALPEPEIAPAVLADPAPAPALAADRGPSVIEDATVVAAEAEAPVAAAAQPPAGAVVAGPRRWSYCEACGHAFLVTGASRGERGVRPRRRAARSCERRRSVPSARTGFQPSANA